MSIDVATQARISEFSSSVPSADEALGSRERATSAAEAGCPFVINRSHNSAAFRPGKACACSMPTAASRAGTKVGCAPIDAR